MVSLSRQDALSRGPMQAWDQRPFCSRLPATTMHREGMMPRFTRRSIVLGAVAAPFVARAQSWPSGNIRLVVPYPPAGSTDAMARLIQNGLQQRLGATIIIENKAGACGSVGSAIVAKSPPDGNTWLLVFDNHGANPFVLGNLPYDTEKDFD